MARGVPTDDVMVQSSLRLPRELLDRLKVLGEKSGLGIGGEIRRRVEETFETEGKIKDAKVGADKATQQLIDSVAYIAAALKEYGVGSWPDDRFAYEVMSLCLNRLLEQRYKPKGELKPRAFKEGIVEMLFGPGEHSATDVSTIILSALLSRLEAWPHKGVA